MFGNIGVYCYCIDNRNLPDLLFEESKMVDESIKYVPTDAVTREEFEELKNEVHLIKGSIKKLLIDIRERFNDLESPLNNLSRRKESDEKGSGPVQIFMGNPPARPKHKPPIVNRIRRKKL